MRRLIPLLAVPLVAIALAVSAIAFAPVVMNALPTGRPGSPGTTTTESSIPAPAWKVGDMWAYNLSFGSLEERDAMPEEMLAGTIPSAALSLTGTLKETVVGSVSTGYGPAWNVTVNVTFSHREPIPIVASPASSMPLGLGNLTVSGFVWYRASDLAPIYSLKTVHVTRTLTLVESPSPRAPYAPVSGVYTMSYQATTQLWYHPPLAVWHFPLGENESWSVASNATIHYWASFHLEGPNVTLGSVRGANFTVPIDFTMHTDRFGDVTTPAGTFRALEAMAYRGPVLPPGLDHDASAMMNLTEGPDQVTPNVFANVWFSGTVGNVVKAELWTGGSFGPRLEMDLIAYHYG